MQRGLFRVVGNAYITVSFQDEVLHSVEAALPIEVSGGVHGTIIAQSLVCSCRTCQEPMNYMQAFSIICMDSCCDNMYRN